ncbi:hypothetical protein [Chitinimonas sp.]|uniref:hypothetical protein n=1 Tax=Chitinimonas sp. TaxID=1934313 RepID=UPI002F9575BF
MKPWAIVAGDPGGGSALAPVVAQMQQQGLPCRLFAYAQSAHAWRERGWVVADAELPDLEGCAGLLCATSVNEHMFELRWLQAARQAGVASLALLDFWSNYRARFLMGAALCLPDRIAVPDELARQEMLRDGFPASCLLVTGQPALDKLAHAGGLSPARRATLRAACGVGEAEQLLLFASQPLRMLAQQLGQHRWIDEQAALADVEAALRELGRPIALRVKPHPRENAADFAALGQVWANSRLAPDALAHDLLKCADIVVGIHSMLLLEACYLGCRVLSYQPGRWDSDPLPSNRSGLSRRCDDPAGLARAIAELLDGPAPVPPSPDGQAAQRVLDAMHALQG